MILRTSFSDGHAQLQNGKIIKIVNILQHGNGKYHIVGKEYTLIQDLDEYPCTSSILGIFEISDVSDELNTWPLEFIKCKLLILPLVKATMDPEHYASFPLLHLI